MVGLFNIGQVTRVHLTIQRSAASKSHLGYQSAAVTALQKLHHRRRRHLRWIDSFVGQRNPPGPVTRRKGLVSADEVVQYQVHAGNTDQVAPGNLLSAFVCKQITAQIVRTGIDGRATDQVACQREFGITSFVFRVAARLGFAFPCQKGHSELFAF